MQIYTITSGSCAVGSGTQSKHANSATSPALRAPARLYQAFRPSLEALDTLAQSQQGPGTHLVLLEAHVALFLVPREGLAAAPNALTWPHPLHKIGWEEANPVADLALGMRLAVSPSTSFTPTLSLDPGPADLRSGGWWLPALKGHEMGRGS